jgi:hypothetical protein
MTAPPTAPPGSPMPKQTVLLNLLEGGRNVMIHLDPRRPGTLVPYRYQREAGMALEIGYAMVNPIPDLDIAEDGIGATLSFGGRREWCFIPWESVYAVSSGIGSIVWPADMPPELRALAPGADAAPGVISLDSRRTPKDRRACERRRAAVAARVKLTAPGAPVASGPEDAA